MKRTSAKETANRPHVVVLGAGFGGLTAARALARAPVRVTLVDRTNHHTFQPLLYQVATAGLSPSEIAQPIRGILRGQRNATVVMAEASRVDLDARRVHFTEGAWLSYDFLIVACGAETSYFGHDQWKEVAPALKSLGDALAIRQRVLLAFEVAERNALGDGPPEPTPPGDGGPAHDRLTFVVIGGGPTGVELAGALAELGRSVLERDFRRIDPSSTKVLLVEAGPRILPTFPADLSERAVAQLRQIGVEVRTGARVTSLEAHRVHLADEKLDCSVVLWAAGVHPNPLTKTMGVPLDREGRIVVQPDLSIAGHANAFVIGDAARFDGPDGQPLPGVSPVAMQEARAVAKSIARTLEGKARAPFEYVDKGQLATIGRSRAVAAIGRAHLSGAIAWWGWLVVHIFYLIGFKNRIVVMMIWAWSYVTYRRGSRLITLHPDASGAHATEAVPGGQPPRETPAPALVGSGQPVDGSGRPAEARTPIS